MPGVLIVEAMAQAGAVAVLVEEENRGKIAFFAGIDDCRFKRVVSPGETLTLTCEIDAMRGPDRPRQGDGDRRRQARRPRHADLCGGAMIGSATGRRIGITGLGTNVPGQGDDERRPGAVRRHLRRVDPASAPGSASAGSRRRTRRSPTSRCRRCARRSPRPAPTRPRSTSLICATVTPGHALPDLVRADGRRARDARTPPRTTCSPAARASCTRSRRPTGCSPPGLSKKALVVGGDVLSKILDWDDRSTLVLFGDGAGAVVMEPRRRRRVPRLRARRGRRRRHPSVLPGQRLAPLRRPARDPAR